jgi:hypothetical protein
MSNRLNWNELWNNLSDSDKKLVEEWIQLAKRASEIRVALLDADINVLDVDDSGDLEAVVPMDGASMAVTALPENSLPSPAPGMVSFLNNRLETAKKLEETCKFCDRLTTGDERKKCRKTCKSSLLTALVSMSLNL